MLLGRARFYGREKEEMRMIARYRATTRAKVASSMLASFE